MIRFSVIIFCGMILNPTFKETQLKNERVNIAYREKEAIVRGYFKQQNLSYNHFNVFIRAFKKEQQLEVWIKEKNVKQYGLLHTYNICAASGTLGPKRREGDMQVPEGVYEINHFNPQSNFYLSLGINYPNASDKILSDSKHPGGDIYIHGNCVTIGCMPLTDDKIKELYVLAVEAKNNGQRAIPVHIFPARLSLPGLKNLQEELHANTTLMPFWNNLALVFNDFESSHQLRKISVTSLGTYTLH